MRKDGESKRIPKVAVLFSLALEGERNMCRGILDYARSHGPWRCHLVEGRPEEQLLNLKKEQFDGLISAGGTREKNTAFASVGAPFVLMEPRPEMLGPDGSSTFPFVTRDSRAIGALAASYYLKRGYKSFAYIGEPEELHWSDERRDGFVDAIVKAGFPCATYGGPYSERERKRWSDERPRMVRFLKTLPRSTAVLAAMDARSVLVLDACAEAGLRVPEDIAILGVDDDPILCESAPTTLSSIRTGRYAMGQKAAEMLDAMLRGQEPEPRVAAMPPQDVVTRESTGYDAMRDPIIARAFAFIRARADAERIGVGDVVKAAGCSRRYLELHFRRHIGSTVKEIILGSKIDRIKSLLERTDMPIGDIASDCGFLNDSYLAVIFKRETGLSMTEWRRHHRDAPDE